MINLVGVVGAVFTPETMNTLISRMFGHRTLFLSPNRPNPR